MNEKSTSMPRIRQGIFIHSLFRTGSTYVWNLFRRMDRFYCFYEPFHQELIRLTPADPVIWDFSPETTRDMRHPVLDHDHFYEYRPLLKKDHTGVPHFKKRFSFDDFCNVAPNPEQKAYIDYLLGNCAGKIPVLQFNRSVLRAAWFKETYPDGFHIYLTRSGRDQFDSTLRMERDQRLDIFPIMDLMSVSLNRKYAAFTALARELPLFVFHAQDFHSQEGVYRELLKQYDIAERYTIFYYLWLSALLEGMKHSDMILDLQLLQNSPSYRDRVQSRLASAGLDVVSLEKCNLPVYENGFLPDRILATIEKKAQDAIFDLTGDAVLERMSGENEEILHHLLGKEGIRRMQNNQQPKASSVTVSDVVERADRMIQALGERLAGRVQELDELEQQHKELREKFNRAQKQMVNLEARHLELEQQAEAEKKARRISDRKIGEIKQENEALKRSLEELAGNLAGKNEQIKQQEKIISRLTAERDRERQRLRAIEKSRSYRIGRWLTYPARRFKKWRRD